LSAENATKEALQLVHDAKAYSRITTYNYLHELTATTSGYLESPQALKERCSELDNMVAKADWYLSLLNKLSGLLSLQNILLRKQFKWERSQRKQLEREFEKMGHCQ